MNFFDGQEFVTGGLLPESRGMFRATAIYYGVQYNHCGRFSLRVDHGPMFTAEGPHAFFTTPGHYYEYGCRDDETRSHNHICGLGPRYQRYIETGLFQSERTPPLIPVRFPERFLGTLRELVTLSRRVIPATPRMVLLYEDLLLQLHESENPVGRLPIWQEDFLNRLIGEISASPSQSWNFEAEAAKCHVTPTHFRRLFKAVAGLPPQQFLIRQRLQVAAQMLLEAPPRTVREIGEACGIGNQYYFSRLFRRHFRVSPLDFRRSMAGATPGS
ncbi:MAG: helix-turn-helix transcriptional regulator [Victivallales bacterium]|nr:helix-turn-helix transcriptional regulator [Victivallales bacterium]